MNWRTMIQNEAKRQGYSGYALARAAGLPLRTVQSYMAGATHLRGDKLELVARVLGLDLGPKRARKGGRRG